MCVSGLSLVCVSLWCADLHAPQGYVTHNGFVDLSRVELVMQAVGVAEDNIFKKRKDDDVRTASSDLRPPGTGSTY